MEVIYLLKEIKNLYNIYKTQPKTIKNTLFIWKSIYLLSFFILTFKCKNKKEVL